MIRGGGGLGNVPPLSNTLALRIRIAGAATSAGRHVGGLFNHSGHETEARPYSTSYLGHGTSGNVSLYYSLQSSNLACPPVSSQHQDYRSVDANGTSRPSSLFMYVADLRFWGPRLLVKFSFSNVNLRGKEFLPIITPKFHLNVL